MYLIFSIPPKRFKYDCNNLMIVLENVFKFHDGLPQPQTPLAGTPEIQSKWGFKNKEWLARNQDNVSGWGDISTRGLLFQ
jgi:hypothetical protein